MVPRNFEDGGALPTTIFGWQCCCCWRGGDGVTLHTCLDVGGAYGSGSTVVAATCSSGSIIWC